MYDRGINAMAAPVTIESLGAADDDAIAAACELLTAAFGRGGYSEERVRSFASDPSTNVAGAWFNGQLIGVGIARVAVDLRAAFAVFGNAAIDELARGKVGVLESGTVSAPFRGSGVGRVASSWLLQWLREQQCTRAVAASWNSGTGQTSRPVLERVGFRAIAESKGEEYRLTNLGGRPCPVCGAPCRCSGTLFVLELSS
jgi:GNAT superfamily N-acetyltransferase